MKVKKFVSASNIKRAFVFAVIVALIVTTVVVKVLNDAKANEFGDLTDEVTSECSEVQNEISEKNQLINGEGFDEYCEKIAREEYGYAKPGENVIYDSSFGK